MIRLALIISHLLIVIWHLNAQVTFQKTYSASSWEVGNSIELTIDGGYIISGTTYEAANNDCYLIKIDDYGDTIWTKRFGGSGSDVCNSMEPTDDGGYVLIGKTTSFGVGGDIYVIRVGSNGDTIWTKTLGGNSDDIGISIHQTISGNFIITGATASFGSGSYDMCLILINPIGNVIWTKVLGGIDGDWGNCVQQTFDYNYIIAGLTNSFGAGMDEVYLVLADSSGDTLWTRTYGGGNNDEVRFVQQTPDSGYVMAGGSGSFSISGVYLIRTDVDGDTLWTRTYGGSCGEVAWAFDQTIDGGYILAGETCGYGADWWDAYILRIDSEGDLIWSRTYQFGNNVKNSFYDVKQTSDGGFIAVGETGDLSTRSVYIVKMDSDGNTSCDDTIVNTIMGETNTIVSSTNTVVGSGGIAAGTNSIVSGTTTVDNVLCFDTITGVDILGDGMREIPLLSIFPNPFRDFATIEAVVPDEISTGRLRIVDLLGVTYKVISLSSGYNDITLLKGDLPASGIYFCILEANERVIEKTKFISLR